MKSIIHILAFTFLLASTAHAQGEVHDVEMRVEDVGSTVPQTGSSLFDKIFRKKEASGNVVYDVPQSIPAIMQKILHLKGSSTAVTYSLLPIGRSLQRPVDLSYDPFTNPRLVTAFHQGTNPDVTNKIFIGYLKPKDQLEVISYNEEAGRFEFQIVRQFSQKPAVFYANRNQCIACHQSQAPVFFRIPWQETTFRNRDEADERNSLVRDLVLIKNGATTDLVSVDADNLLIQKLFGGFPGINDAQKFEDSVDDADRLSRAQRFWIYGCGTSNSCRLAMVLREIDPDMQNASLYQKYQDDLVKEFSKSDLRRQNTYLPDIVSYDLESVLRIDNESFGHLPYNLAPEGPTDLAKSALNQPSVLLDLINASSHIVGDQSPTTRRPISYEEFFEAYEQKQFISPLGFLSRDLIDHITRDAHVTKQEMLKELVNLYQTKNELFSPRALRVSLLMYEMLKGLNSAAAQEFDETDFGGPTPPKEAFSGSLPVFFSNPTLMKFAHNCGACHADPSVDNPPPFLVGPEPQVRNQMTALRSRLLRKLENRQMPPDPTLRQTLIDSGDYQELIDYVKSLSSTDSNSN